MIAFPVNVAKLSERAFVVVLLQVVDHAMCDNPLDVLKDFGRFYRRVRQQMNVIRT